MPNVDQLIANNARWAKDVRKNDPEFFTRLAQQQTPRFLWVGCSDSRVPANQITGLPPGEVFVHRNVANVVQETDFNALAVLQYAIDVLKVTDVIVCGHYGCGGVKAALDNLRHGLIDNWLSPIRALARTHQDELMNLDETSRVDRLCELNVVSQAKQVGRTTIVEDAWERGQEVAVHSWIYRLDQGVLTPLKEPIASLACVEK
ncbi:MAG: carbonate dehydratase [Akkermansiaceae bacterium]